MISTNRIFPASVPTRYARAPAARHCASQGGHASRFLLSSDGTRIAAVNTDGRMTKFDMSSALARSVPEHLLASRPSVPLNDMPVAALGERGQPVVAALQRFSAADESDESDEIVESVK